MHQNRPRELALALSNAYSWSVTNAPGRFLRVVQSQGDLAARHILQHVTSSRLHSMVATRRKARRLDIPLAGDQDPL